MQCVAFVSQLFLTFLVLCLKDWMAFEELHQPLFREHGSIYFANGNSPSKEFNYAFCEVCFFIALGCICLMVNFQTHSHSTSAQ